MSTKHPNTGGVHYCLHYGPDQQSTIVLPVGYRTAQVSPGGYNEPVEKEVDLIAEGYIDDVGLELTEDVTDALHRLADDLVEEGLTPPVHAA